MCTTISKCTEFKLPPLYENKLLLQTKQAYQTCIHSLHTIAKNACNTLSCLFFLRMFLVNPDQKLIPTIGRNLFKRNLFIRNLFKEFSSKEALRKKFLGKQSLERNIFERNISK